MTNRRPCALINSIDLAGSVLPLIAASPPARLIHPSSGTFLRIVPEARRLARDGPAWVTNDRPAIRQKGRGRLDLIEIPWPFAVFHRRSVFRSRARVSEKSTVSFSNRESLY